MKRSNLTLMVFFTTLILLGNVIAGNKEKIPITTSSKKAMASFLKGRDLFENLRAQESLQHFEKAAAEDPNFGLCYYYLSLAQPNAKGFFEKLDNAVALVDQVSEGEKLWILGFQAGVNAFTMKQREYFQKLVELYPRDERGLTLLGNHFFGTQDYDKAIDCYEKATTINPDFSQPYNQMGYAYQFLNDYDKAEHAFKQYIKLIPNDPNPYDSYAELLMKMGKYEDSVESYKKALAVNANFVASYLGIASNLNFLGKHEKARAQLEKLVEIARNDGERRAALFATVVSYVDEGENQKALKILEKQFVLAEKINDAANMAGDHITMGNILLEAGETEKAQHMFEKAVKRVQQSNLSQEVKENAGRTFLFNSVRVALANKDLTSAKRKWKNYQKQVNAINNPFQIRLAHELAGRIALAEKNFDKALEELKQANLQNPYNLYRIALVYRGKGDNKKAKEWFNNAATFNALNSLNQAFVRNKNTTG